MFKCASPRKHPVHIRVMFTNVWATASLKIRGNGENTSLPQKVSCSEVICATQLRELYVRTIVL